MDKIDFDELDKLLTWFDKSSISTIAIERSAKGDYKISIQKNTQPAQSVILQPSHSGHQEPSPAQAPKASQHSQPKALPQEQTADHETLTSPIVGSFYRAPNPDSPPFVQIGDTVKKGSCLCILEAMKVLNEFEAEFDMEIIDVLSENQQLVEYGQPLFKVKRL